MTGCVVDAPNEAFQCVEYPDKRSTVPFSKGFDLECVSPKDLEDALKACQNHQILEVTICQVKPFERKFLCQKPSGDWFSIGYMEANNYFCLSDQDRRRVIERCQ